jgi:OOP family OmpA-OmpF porin
LKKITIKNCLILKTMNYSTLKKTVALSFVSLMIVGAANAQTKSDSSATTTNAKVFGGRGQYNTWSIGVNVGVTSNQPVIGGSTDFRDFKGSLGYGISVRDQLAHSFGIQADVLLPGSNFQGTNSGAGFSSFKTQVQYAASISGIVNVATIDYIRRKNAINFYVSAGAGLSAYNPILTATNGTVYNFKTIKEAAGQNSYVKAFYVPVGAGVKFRLTEPLSLNVGYTEYFFNGDNVDGIKVSPDRHKDNMSYGYAGLEYTFGPKSKPSLEWVNPVAMMYDELYDAALRQEVAALKGRVTNVENAVNDLKKDSDGDGVSDQFDKCPNTPAGTVVDGSGCAIVFPKIDTSLFVRKPIAGAATGAYSNIQFEFDSSVLRTSSYPVLDATSADLRSSGAGVELDGFASSEGTAAHNLRLSKDRANSVKTYLVNSGVEAKHIKVKAFGETHPIADNSTEEGRVLNRRVEFKK